ncbi:MAG TPA: hypothetical protein VJ949_03025, partial [Cryomorphaceae bacterium]|nr:hypothetical protein [Cryomorphaceae bacterium]
DSAVQKFVSLAGVCSPANEIIRAQLEAQSPLMAMAAIPKLDSLKAGFEVAVPGPPLNSLFRRSSQPFLISWFAYNPKEIFSDLEIPVLIVNGTTDIQVAVSDAEQLHQAAVNAELLIVEGMNHVLKDAPEGRMANIAVYSDSSQPLSEGLVERVVEFLATE